MTRVMLLMAGMTAVFMPTGGWSAVMGQTMAEVVAKIDARCPYEFPEHIQPVPSRTVLASMTPDQLFAAMDNWNPVVGKRVAGELGRRGPEMLPRLIGALQHEKAQVRSAAVRAINAVVSEQVEQWQVLVPDEKHMNAATSTVRKRYLYLVPSLCKLTNDPNAEVRRALVRSLRTFCNDSSEATYALTLLWNDKDEYIAEDSLRAICHHGYGKDAFLALTKEQRMAAIRRGFQSELGSGRQPMMGIVAALPEEEKRSLISEMLHNLTVHPDRNMMFRDGGRWGCMDVLTKLEVKEALPLMFATLRTERSDFLLDRAVSCARTFGPDAELAVPELKNYIADLKRRRAFYKEAVHHPRTREAMLKDYDARLKKAEDLLRDIESGALATR